MRDIELLRTKINSSTALAMATVQGSDLHNTQANKTVFFSNLFINTNHTEVHIFVQQLCTVM